MALSAKSKANNGSSEPREQPKKGNKMARLVGLVDLGHQPGYSYNGEMVESSHKIEFTYELVNDKMEDGRPFWVSEDVNVNSYEATADKPGQTSKMMKRVRAIESCNNVDSNDGDEIVALIGEPCMVDISHNQKGYAKVQGVSPAPEGFPIPQLQNPSLVFDFDNPSIEAWNRLSKFTKDKIKRAHNYSDDLKRKLEDAGAEDA